MISASTVGPASDIWSLAAVLYELLTGRPPFGSGSFATICARVIGNEQPAPIATSRGDVPRHAGIERAGRPQRCCRDDAARGFAHDGHVPDGHRHRHRHGSHRYDGDGAGRRS